MCCTVISAEEIVLYIMGSGCFGGNDMLRHSQIINFCQEVKQYITGYVYFEVEEDELEKLVQRYRYYLDLEYIDGEISLSLLLPDKKSSLRKMVSSKNRVEVLRLLKVYADYFVMRYIHDDKNVSTFFSYIKRQNDHVKDKEETLVRT